MNKSKIMFSLLGILLIIAVCFGLTYIPHKIVNIKPSEVSSICIFDGGTGKNIKITNRSDIEYIISNLNSIKFRRDKLSLGYMGYSYRTTIYKNDGSVYKEFIINSRDTIRKDPFFFKDRTNSIDYDYIRNLINTSTQ